MRRGRGSWSAPGGRLSSESLHSSVGRTEQRHGVTAPESTTRNRRCGACPATGSRVSPCFRSEIKAVARQLFRMYASLSALVPGFTTRKIAPALRIPKMEITASAVFSRKTATRSPGSTFRSRRRCASRLLSRSSSRYVSRFPPATRAVFSGFRRTDSVRNCSTCMRVSALLAVYVADQLLERVKIVGDHFLVGDGDSELGLHVRHELQDPSRIDDAPVGKGVVGL